MDVIFNKPGKYKNGIQVVKVHKKEVEEKKVFNIFDINARSYIKAELAQVAVKKKKPTSPAEKPAGSSK